jgi:periplasmic protein TonB
VNGIRLPLALSLFGHAVLLALLVLFVTAAPPLPLPPPSGGIVVNFAPSLPQPPAPPAPPEVKPPPPEVQPPPPPPLPPPTAEAPTVEAPPLPPRKPPVRRVLRRLERPQPQRAAVSVPPPQPMPAPQSAYARLPTAPPAPSTAVSPGYQAILGAWLERHKHYPESARERGEEGRAVLQFVVDRSGRVLDFAVVESSGYPDLDAAVESMMRGATLPPFPADMPQTSIKVSVAIRFSLAG